MLQTVCGEVLPIFEGFLTLTLGQCPLKISVFIASIINEFVLGLNILPAYDASVDLGCQTLCPAEDVVLLWSQRAGTGPQPFSMVVASDQVICEQCEGMMMA
jgi:hypothetical protein